VYIRDLNSAWKMDARRKKPDPDPDEDDDEETEDSRRNRGVADAQRVRDAAYQKMCARLQNAWRGTRDAPHRTPPDELLRRHTRTETNESAQARRDAAWNDYKDRLSNAWRSPPGTDPSAAMRIERQAEQWRHGR
jgi:hypothetical protein